MVYPIAVDKSLQSSLLREPVSVSTSWSTQLCMHNAGAVTLNKKWGGGADFCGM